MARRKETNEPGVDELVGDLLSNLAKTQTSTKAVLAGDLANRTWGLPIGPIAFQYVLGGVNVLPCQRYYTVSGMHKSFKSTLFREICCWYAAAGGIAFSIDTENKSSDSLTDAMTWWRQEQLSKGKIIFDDAETLEGWQEKISEAVKFAKRVGPRGKGQRIPIFVVLDSLTARASSDAQEAIAKEGHAEGRAYPITAASTANFLKGTSLLGTTLSIGIVRHLSVDISAQASYGGPKMREAGATAVNFQYSAALRMARIGTIRAAGHPEAPFPDLPVEGYTIQMHCDQSCLGPVIDRKIEVDVLWQYVQQEDGTVRQALFYCWNSALGKLLWSDLYNPDKTKRAYESEQSRLRAYIDFTATPNKTVGEITCKKLGLTDASFAEFGKAINDNPEAYQGVQNYLKISRYPSLQDVEIEAAKSDE